MLFTLSACESATEPTLNSKKVATVIPVKTPVKVKVKVKAAEVIAVEKDLWRYISNRHSLSAPSDKNLFWHIDWFKKNPDYLTRVTKRAEPYLYLITKEVEKAGLPIEIALLPIVESAYYPFSYSHGTASGLWQFIPSTGKLYGLKDNWWYDGRRDVLASTRAAVRYLTNLNKLFKGDWLLAIAAYNSGPGRVQKAVRKNKRAGKKTDFWHLDLPAETRGYVPRLLAVAKLIKNPKAYGQSITFVENKPQLDSVVLDSQFDLALISDWTDLSLDEIYSLNPGLKRWATPSGGAHTILLPIDKIDKFKDNLKNSSVDSRVKWLRYKVGKGDSLSYIAHKFKTTIDQIKSVNNLDTSLIKVGEHLIVPVAQKDSSHYSLSEDQREQQRMNSKKRGTKVIYKISPGDSLWKLAKKYNTSIDNIIKWNHLSRTKPLKVGKKLVIWKPYVAKNKNLSNITNVGINIDRKVSYKVKNGDNLSTIASKFGVSVKDIKNWNNIKGNKPLQIGQKLKIIVNVVNSKMK